MSLWRWVFQIQYDILHSLLQSLFNLQQRVFLFSLFDDDIWGRDSLSWFYSRSGFGWLWLLLGKKWLRLWRWGTLFFTKEGHHSSLLVSGRSPKSHKRVRERMHVCIFSFSSTACGDVVPVSFSLFFILSLQNPKLRQHPILSLSSLPPWNLTSGIQGRNQSFRQAFLQCPATWLSFRSRQLSFSSLWPKRWSSILASPTSLFPPLYLSLVCDEGCH